MKALTHITLLAVALCVLTFQAKAAPGHLEWQLPQLTNGQDSLKIRFWAKPKNHDAPPPQKRQFHLISPPFQHFMVCAGQVVTDSPAFITPFEEGGKQGHYNQ